ncbi:MAG: M23 family metallopeptidase [Armatimonadetes bacterium]|nr:M23 family metallopeptidase [Armatimonadota bacterium]
MFDQRCPMHGANPIGSYGAPGAFPSSPYAGSGPPLAFGTPFGGPAGASPHDAFGPGGPVPPGMQAQQFQQMLVQILQILVQLLSRLVGQNQFGPSPLQGGAGQPGGGFPAGAGGFPQGGAGFPINAPAGVGGAAPQAFPTNYAPAPQAFPQTAPTGGGQALPYNGQTVKPLDKYTITSEFGPRWGKEHTGIDMAAPTGTAVQAFRDGEVMRVANDPDGYGNYIDVRHSDGTFSRYAHLSAENVEVGQQVGAGSTIGAVGSTGRSTGPHLHFEIRTADGNPIDPEKVINL